MSQFEVLCVLKEAARTSDPWRCTNEVAEETGTTRQTTSRKLSKLLYDGHIKARFNPKTGSREYRCVE